MKSDSVDLRWLLLSSTAVCGIHARDLQDRIDAAKVVLDQIMGAKDSSIP